MLAHPTIGEMINVRYCLDPNMHEDVDFYLGLCYYWYWTLYGHFIAASRRQQMESKRTFLRGLFIGCLLCAEHRSRV